MMLTYLMTFSLPPFTQEWATTYLQVLFESFLFALGVPAAIYNLIDSDIRYLAETRNRARRYFLGTGLLYVVVLAIVWFIPPDPESQSRVSTLPELSSIVKSLMAIAVVTVLPFGVLVMGLWLNRQFEREKVVARLGNVLLKTFEVSGHLDSIALKDLTYLGEHSKAGNEKGVVLDVIDQIVSRVLEKATYGGFELEILIRHIPTILNNTAESGNEENYQRALEVLSRIWRRLYIRRITDDSFSTRETIRHLALHSVEKMSEATTLAYLEIAADCDSHLVFDIGLASFKANKYLLATAALAKLEQMTSNALSSTLEPEAQRETRANLLGMTAHFAASGPSSFHRAKTSIQYNEELFIPPLLAALADAVDYQYMAGRFETADKLQLLIAEASKMELPDNSNPASENRVQLSKTEQPLATLSVPPLSKTEQSLASTNNDRESSRRNFDVDKEIIAWKSLEVSQVTYAFCLLFFALAGFLIIQMITTEETVIAFGTTVVAVTGMWITVILSRLKSILRIIKTTRIYSK
jgi:hypothetical protein